MCKNKIIIMGGGPAGMMAAISASSEGNSVILVEKNAHLGRKLLMTGGGRCNLTNACDERDFLDHFSKTGSFLRDAFKLFGREELIAFFRKRGLEVKTEDKGRVFPITDKASSVLDMLEKELKCLDVEILFNKEITGLNIEKEEVRGVILKDGSEVEAMAVVIATGGLSYEKTGSTGEGIRIAERTGHNITLLRPGLVSLTLKGDIPEKLEGLSLGSVRLIFRAGSSKFTSEVGSIIFTRVGISGPAVLSSSTKVVDWLEEEKDVSLEIDMMPERDLKQTEKDMLSEFVACPQEELKRTLKKRIPGRLSDVMLGFAGILPDKQANQVTADERKKLSTLIKAFKFDVVKDSSFEKAQITRGGVSVKDIDPKTMESKKIKGLYFAGEIIDVDGDSGGFNLQAAFSTGHMAGRFAGKQD